jgi:hypothetical protein
MVLNRLARAAKFAFAALLTVFVSSGKAQTTPQFPWGVELPVYQINPPPMYREWFGQMSACVGIEKPFEEVTWWLVPNAPQGFFFLDMGLFAGYFDMGKIYMLEQLYMDPVLVRHELGHYLLEPHHGHPSPPYPPPGELGLYGAIHPQRWCEYNPFGGEPFVQDDVS